MANLSNLAPLPSNENEEPSPLEPDSALARWGKYPDDFGKEGHWW
jgi:hypothetical protein